MFRKHVVPIILIFILLVSLVACSSTKPKSSLFQGTSAAGGADDVGSEDDNLPENYPTKYLPDGNLWSEVNGGLQLPVDTSNSAVLAQIRWFQNNQEYLNRCITRAAPYIYYIYQQTKKMNLPAELALIPVNESAYNPFLFSKAGATGLWQMMPGTASGFGLKIDWWYDGRRDIVTSTKAALKYITYLHYYFNNDWLLAIAAYDAGEGTVQAAILRNQRNNLPTDFWSLPLPRETKTYVPKLLALAAIINDPDKYSVHLTPVNNGPYFSEIDVGSQIGLAKAAKLAEVDVETIRTLNPGFRRFASDPDGPYTLLIPQQQADVFRANLAKVVADELVTWKKHIVVAGESLPGIARKFHVDLAQLRKINELTSNRIKAKQEILIPVANQNEANDLLAATHASLAEEKIPGPKQVVHTVKAGETLNSVAKRYGVKPHEIAYWNQISTNETLAADDELVLWRSDAGKPVKIFVVHYRVKSGDTLNSIAKKFGTTATKIRSLNKIEANGIRINQVIHVPKKGKRTFHHKVYRR